MKILVRLLFVICFTGAYAQQRKTSGSSLWLTAVEKSGKETSDKTTANSFNFNSPIDFYSQRQYQKNKINFSKNYTVFLVYRDTSGVNDTPIAQLVRGNNKVEIKSDKVITNNLIELNKGNAANGFMLTAFNSNQDLKKSKDCALVFNETLGSAKQSAQVYEMLYFPTVLNKLERAKTETYLSLKYGISLTDRDYFNSKGEKIWVLKENKDYKTRITGISRDDSYNLHQRQSKNYSNDGLHIGLSAAASTGKDLQETDNLDYFIWSDNNKPASFGKENAPEGFDIFNRVWKINSKMAKAHSFKITLNKEKLTALQESGLPYWLVNYTGNSGIDFSKAKLLSPTENNKKQLVFDNITFDATGSSYFTIVRAPEFFADLTVNKTFCDAKGQSIVKIDMVGGYAPYHIKISAPGYGNEMETKEKSVQLDNLPDGQYTIEIRSGSTAFASQFEISSFKDNAIEMEKTYSLNDGETLEITPKIDAVEDIVSYSWLKEGNAVSTESTLKTTQIGNYKLVVQNKKGCTKEFPFEVKDAAATATGWKIYPNPAEAGQNFSVRFSLNEKKSVSVLIHDLNGKLIKNSFLGKIENHNYVDSLSKSGTYLVTVVINGEESAYKLIIK